MSWVEKGPNGELIGHAGDPGPKGTNGGNSGCYSGDGWSVVRVNEYLHGWEKNSHAGMRGPWGSVSEAELLDHLIYWLESCKPVMRDPAGNEYCGVDSNVVRQTLESLRRYRRLITEPLGKQLADVWRNGGKAGQGLNGVR